MCINHIVAAESLVTEGSPTQLQSMSWAATVIHCKLVIWVAEGFASPNIPVVTGDSLGSSAFVDTKAYGKQENLFQTSNNFCIILLSSLLYYMLLVEKQYMAWKGRFDSKAARKLHLQKCRLLLVRQHIRWSYSDTLVLLSYSTPALILQAISHWRSISLVAECRNAKDESCASENSLWMKLFPFLWFRCFSFHISEPFLLFCVSYDPIDWVSGEKL